MTDPRHAESNAAHNLALLKRFLGCQLAQLNKALEKAKADVAEFTTSLDAGRCSCGGGEELAAVEESQKCLRPSGFRSRGFRKAFPGGVEDVRRRAELWGRCIHSRRVSFVGARHRHISQDSKWCQWSRLAKKELCRACSPRLAHSEIWKFEAGTGEDPFAKVKGVITDLFGRLQGGGFD